jgi:uncharacterized membrane protein YbhN (UPF0104 family)
MLPATAAGQTGVGVRPGRGLRSRGSWIASTISVALSVGLIVLAIVKLDLAAVAGSLTSVEGGWVILGVCLMVCSFLARAESWFAVIRAAAPGAPIGRAAV